MTRYVAEKHGQYVKEVWIHGREVSAIATACDTEEGWVDVLVTGLDGGLIVFDGQAFIERLIGEVRVVIDYGENEE